MDDNNEDIVDAEIVEVDTVEKRELALVNITAEFEAFLEAGKSEDEEYEELIKEERRLRALMQDVLKRKADIESKRYDRRVKVSRMEREKREQEIKLEELRRYQRLEAEKAAAFVEMVEYCKEQDFFWVKNALPHQWEGAMTIAHYGSAILGDEAGLGKTMTAIMSMDMKKSKKILCVVPNDIVSTFTLEIMMWAPHRNVVPVSGANPAARKVLQNIIESSAEIIVVVNYESLWKDCKWLENVHWDDIYVDEAHNMKNENGLTFFAVDSYRRKNCVPMTATSILNDPKDLYTSLHMIDPLHFYDSRVYLDSYCVQDSFYKWQFRTGGEKALVESLKGRFIKRTYAEVGIKLPKQTVNEVVIPRELIHDQQMRIMRQIHEYNEILLDSGESTSINAIIAVITRERQASTFPAGIEVKVTEKMRIDNPNLPPVGTVIFKVPDDMPSIKSDIAVKRLMDMIEAGHRCVVFSQFKTFLEDLDNRLKEKGIRSVRYDGDTHKNIRLQIKRDFLRAASGERKTEYQYDVVLANYKTGGVGLSFTEATYMLCPDEEWNPAKNYQAHSRINRIGQTEETLVDILRVERSIDMWMKTINQHKKAINDGFESELNTLESLRKYFEDMIEDKPAIEAVPEVEFDEDFLSELEAM